MDLMDRKERLDHNTWKRDQALKRKGALVKAMGQKAGKEMKGMTVGVILDGEGTRGDLDLIPGFLKLLEQANPVDRTGCTGYPNDNPHFDPSMKMSENPIEILVITIAAIIIVILT